MSFIEQFELVLRFDFSIAQATPSNNTIKEMHFAQYKRLREQWGWEVLAALKNRPAAPVPLAYLVIDRFCAGDGLDWDNAYGGLKPLLDCLVRPTHRNPTGLGVIEDDNPRNMPIAPLLRQHPADRGQGSTRVRIFELQPALAAQPT